MLFGRHDDKLKKNLMALGMTLSNNIGSKLLTMEVALLTGCFQSKIPMSVFVTDELAPGSTCSSSDVVLSS